MPTAVEDLFERAAPAIRRFAEPLGVAAPIPPFERPVIAVALVARPTPTGGRLYAVGLTATGTCLQLRVEGPGTAYGPTESLRDLELAVADAAGRPLADAAGRVGKAISDVGCRHPNLVSVDWDRVVVGSGGAGPVEPYRHQGIVIGRH